MECDNCRRDALIRQGRSVLCALCYARGKHDAYLRGLGSGRLPNEWIDEYIRKVEVLAALIRQLKRLPVKEA